ncbi:hypothetical protein, partial [Bacillus cereus group sp. Bce002]|uniref:hypothetical protein n=1 Tax=Bacillus cereus group sp. Bce002 TaxID=3445259 RepID=UPI003F69A313
GSASTLFSSILSISSLVASVALGVVGELFNYFSTLYVSLIGAVAALILLRVFIWLAAKHEQRASVTSNALS